MMTTFYNDNELEGYKTVQDKELDELLQEVRQKFDNKYFLIENKYTIKKWLKKPEIKTFYTLLYRYNNIECQVINFCREHDGSINTGVPKSYIHTLFCGLLNGYDYGFAKYYFEDEPKKI